MRAMNDAILVGIGTALADDPLLTCRLPGMAARSPVRVVLDRMLRLPLTGRLVQTAGAVPLWVVAGEGAPSDREDAMRSRGVNVQRVKEQSGRFDLAGVLTMLASRGITRLMVEGGPILAAALLREDLVDEAVLLMSPTDIGHDGIDALEGLPLTALTQSPKLKLTGTDAVGPDRIEMLERA
jgi:diaminohydroxyphosphoribosylaminopyrimidine deaminase/5-amino-6-(5-phosphoribosylamino)uracil reductase